MIAASEISYDSYKAEMGFALRAFTAKRVLDGVIDYELTIDSEIWNEDLGVALAFARDNKSLATIPLQGVASTLNPQRKRQQVVGFSLAPEFAKLAILVFQLHPNTKKVALIHLHVDSWPVTILHKDKTKEIVTVDRVKETIEREPD